VIISRQHDREARSVQSGIGAPTRNLAHSFVKWLQLLLKRLYESALKRGCCTRGGWGGGVSRTMTATIDGWMPNHRGAQEYVPAPRGTHRTGPRGSRSSRAAARGQGVQSAFGPVTRATSSAYMARGRPEHQWVRRRTGGSEKIP